MPPTVQTNEPERDKRPQRAGERRLDSSLNQNNFTYTYTYVSINRYLFIADRSL